MRKLFLGLLSVGILLASCHSNNSGNNADSAKTAPVSATTTPAVGSQNPPLPNGPGMKFEVETHDFGKIQQGEKVTYKFNFANIGKAPLIISNAVASCGCTTPEWPKGPIKPGEGGQIIVTFNSEGKTGLQDKQITITANTDPAQNIVHLVGEVVAKK